MCLWSYSEYYLLDNITCFIWVERHLKLEVLKDEKRWTSCKTLDLASLDLVTRIYILDMYVRGKNSKCLKNNSLCIQICWYFISLLYDSGWRYDLATPWSIFHEKIKHKYVNYESKWTFTDLCICKRCNDVKICAFKEDDVILCFYPDEAVSMLAVKTSLRFTSFERQD